MPQKKIAELFDVKVPAISKHFKNIFKSGELDEKVVVSILEITTQHVAITGKTQNKEKMGLTSWKNSPNGKIRKSDVSIAKNYLDEKELKPLNRIVTMYLDYAEDQAEQGNVMTMKDWAEKLNAFLQFNQRDILQDAGKVTAAISKSFAESEYDRYKPIQDQLFESDFDKLIKKQLEDGNKK
ncbi:MAG: hypothetical protein DRI95_03460 [Bacteroidetes bacterium]|nr:MAG: hypothetical protein DRI95_03460 [Bacteroidota bacterium]